MNGISSSPYNTSGGYQNQFSTNNSSKGNEEECQNKNTIKQSESKTTAYEVKNLKEESEYEILTDEQMKELLKEEQKTLEKSKKKITKFDLTAEDSDLAELVRNKIPSNTYESVKVDTLEEHEFFGGKKIKTRVIQLKRMESFFPEFFNSFFSLIWNGKDSVYGGKATNENLLAKYLLNSSLIEDNDQEKQNKDKKTFEKDMTKLYYQCKSITIYLPMDCSCNADVNIKSDSGLITFSIQSGKFVSFLLRGEKHE